MLYQGVTYSIVNIQRQAAGDYTCTAWNGVGKQKNAKAAVTVHCKLHSFVVQLSMYTCILGIVGARDLLGFQTTLLVGNLAEKSLHVALIKILKSLTNNNV